MWFLTVAFTITRLGTCSREKEVSNFRIEPGIEGQLGKSYSKLRNLLHLNLVSSYLGEVLEWSTPPKSWSAPPAVVLRCPAPPGPAEPQPGPAFWESSLLLSWVNSVWLCLGLLLYTQCCRKWLISHHKHALAKGEEGEELPGEWNLLVNQMNKSLGTFCIKSNFIDSLPELLCNISKANCTTLLVWIKCTQISVSILEYVFIDYTYTYIDKCAHNCKCWKMKPCFILVSQHFQKFGGNLKKMHRFSQKTRVIVLNISRFTFLKTYKNIKSIK